MASDQPQQMPGQEYISEAVFNYLNMKTTGALLLTGNWGSGKTYFIKNHIFPKIKADNKYTPLLVSLFGETNRNTIAQKVVVSYLDVIKVKDEKKQKTLGKIPLGKLASGFQSLWSSSEFLKQFVDFEKLLLGTGDAVLRILPANETIIFFDDLERLSETFDHNDFLGLVNDLVETRGCKVVLIANYAEIKARITYKEKTIDKILHYVPNIEQVLNNLINSYAEDGDFKSYLESSKEFFINSLKAYPDTEVDAKDLQRSYSNIRTVKFALEHFRQLFTLVKGTGNLNDLKLQQLRNLWIFTLSVSTEFRKPDNISFTDRKKLDKHVDFFNLEEGDITVYGSDNKIINNDTEDKRSFLTVFTQKYYRPNSERYIFFPEIYDFITAGISINKTEFLKNLDDSFNVINNEITPAHEILNNLLREGYWNFKSDIEFKDTITELYNRVALGELRDIISYLNAGTYLIGFSEIINRPKEQVIENVKKGIDRLFASIKVNDFVYSQLEMVSDSFKEPEVQGLLTYIKGKMSENESKQILDFSQELEYSFLNQPNHFIDTLLPSDLSTRTPNDPVLEKIDKLKVSNGIQSWPPDQIMKLTSLLKIRYLDTSFSDRLTDELGFLQALMQGIEKKNHNEKSLTNKILQENLKPRVQECIKHLENLMQLKENKNKPESDAN